MAQFHSLQGLRYRYMQKILQKAKTTPHCTNVSHCITITITHPNKTTDSGDGGWRLFSTTFSSQLGQFPHCMPSVCAPNSTHSQVWSSPPPWFPFQRSYSRFTLVCSTAESGLYCSPFPLPSMFQNCVCNPFS